MNEAAKAEMEKTIAPNAENNLFTKSAHRKALLDWGAVREGPSWLRGRPGTTSPKEEPSITDKTQRAP